jgi:hypothetical protein
MADPASPIIDFYPTEFASDLNGKRFAWQAITLLPWIDEARLLAAIATVEGTLTPEERFRNSARLETLFVRCTHPLGAAILAAEAARAAPPAELPIDPALSGGLNGRLLLPMRLELGSADGLPDAPPLAEWWLQPLLVSARLDSDGVAATRDPEDLVGRVVAQAGRGGYGIAELPLQGRGRTSDVAAFPPWLDAMFHAATVLERRLPSFPFGGSVLAVARRPLLEAR